MKAAEAQKTAGFVDRGRGAFRHGGGALATGTKRSCVADGLWVLLHELKCTAKLDRR